NQLLGEVIGQKTRRDFFEYVIVHEMVHLLEATRSEPFIAILQQHYPIWREARAELNELPLGAEAWRE
ncbi:MAG: M48 family metallopeptidase, partial [Verrucomicrobiota bacterium]